jgi:ATP-binding cassette subfamily D (ALD) protein 3
LITHAEEIAFLQGSKRELQLLDASLHQVTQHKLHQELMMFKQRVIDQWLLKYQVRQRRRAN